MEEKITTGEDFTAEQRMESLENQFYLAYLQLNALTKLLVEKDIIQQEEISTEMETLNKEIYKVTNELIEKAKAEAQVVVEPTAE